jgi:hypothetical protein
LKTCFPERLRSVIGVAQPYLSYFLDIRANFDSEASARELNSLGIAPPKWDQYSEVILIYCRESRWGQRKLQPEYLYYSNDFRRYASAENLKTTAMPNAKGKTSISVPAASRADT